MLIGSVRRLQATFRDTAGALADPSAVAVAVTDPSGTVTTPTAVNASTGVWYADVTLSAAGRWFYTFTGTGSVEAVVEGDVHVSAIEVAEASHALCTLAEVREFLEVPDDDTERDDKMETLVAAASRAIMRETRREFAPATASEARTFKWYRTEPLRLGPHDLRSVTSVKIHPGTAGEVTAVEDTDFALAPILARSGIYHRLEFAPAFAPTVSTFEEAFGVAKVEITGAWGFASVPEDVRQAAIITAASWATSDVAAHALDDLSDPRSMSPALPTQYAIPTAALRLLAPFSRRSVY